MHIRKQAELDDEPLSRKLRWFRNEPRARVWEALCAVMAALSSRKEKGWLEAFQTTEDLKDGIKQLPMCKSKRSARRKGAIRKIIEEQCSAGCGYFSHYLVKPGTDLRVSFAPGATTLTPASLVVTTRLPFWEALRSLDDGGPLRGEAASRDWCLKAGRQFAFQGAIFGAADGSHKCRVDAESLLPDARLRDLLRCRKPVVVLEVVAALAPREVAKKQGLGEIVKAELTRVMREAKDRGEAVIFCLGSDSP